VKNQLKLSVATAGLLLALATTSVQAAGMADTGCGLAGDGRIGYLHTNQNTDDNQDGDYNNVDWGAMIGEGRGVLTCGLFNVQGDFAYYGHDTNDLDAGKAFNGKDLGGETHHFGGALFVRDPSMGLIGITASKIGQDFFSKQSDYLRFGLVGEYFATENLTFGASAHMYNGEMPLFKQDIDHDGFELAANVKYYATPDLSFKIEAALLNADYQINNQKIDNKGYSIGAEVEYLFLDQGLSVFGGARMANRDLSNDGFKADIDDLQIYAGLKIAFGGNDQSLVTRDRTGPVDNTSIFLEKLPDTFTSYIAAQSNSGMAVAP
jgi:hypothetical protein